MRISDNELRRIRSGPADDDDEGLMLVRVFFTAADAAAVIARAREVLGRVVERMDSWPAEEEWPEILPSWFVERSAPEAKPSASALVFDPADRAAAWLERWQATTPTETEEATADKAPWTLSNWLFYFDPNEEEGDGNDRSWWWWHAGTDAPGTGWIDVATTGLPFGTGTLYWLIEASGGTDPGY